MKGYKVFNPDFTCHGFQYTENTEFVHEGELELCRSGFHFCEKAIDCFSYYRFDPQNIVCEVESRGETITEDDEDKIVTNKLYVGKRLTWSEVLDIVNTGKANTGFRNSGNDNSGSDNSGFSNSGYANSGNDNSGNRNSGHGNTGNNNSGSANSGHRNSGYHNSGNNNSGFANSGNWRSGSFCTEKDPYVCLFDKPTDIRASKWFKSEAVRLLYHVKPNKWIDSLDMTDEEKKQNPTYQITRGYLKTISMHEAWEIAWDKFTDEEKQVFLDLPNFDAGKFKEITGIKV